MGQFSAKELEIIDYMVAHINCEIFSNDEDERDTIRLEYSLCPNETEKRRATKKRVAKYKSKIDKCDPDIAGYMGELVKHSPEYVDDGEVRDHLTKNFVICHYQELIEELALIGKEKIEDFTLSSTVKSKGYSYKKIKNYIDAVCNITHYINYRSFLEIRIGEEQELSKSVNKYISVKQGKTEIACLNDLFSKNKDILPESIKNAYKSIGVIKTLFIYQVEDNTIKNVCLDDLDPFENVPGTKIIEYHCIESNYLNLMSKIEDGTFVFFDNLTIDLYLYEYAKAFILAYSEFETILNQNQSLITDTQEQKALKIFSYILNAEYKNGYFGGDYENIEELKNKKGMYVTNDEMYEWGYKGGQFFKAWEIILNNPIIFEPLFEKFIFPKSIEKIGVKHEASTNNLLKSTIDDYRDEFKPLSLANIPKSKKIGDKWHALLYLIEIEVYQKKIPTNVDGAFIKSEIEQIGKDRCKNSGQGFYRQVRDLKGNIKDNKSVKRLFNDGWKTVIIELSNNDENIIKYLNTF